MSLIAFEERVYLVFIALFVILALQAVASLIKFSSPQ